MTVSATCPCHFNCCKPFAVDGTSMRIFGILGTAVLAVSILVVRLGSLLIAAQ